MYTAEDARREVRECVAEGYGFDYIRIFINDLVRGRDISREDARAIMHDLIDGKMGDVEITFGTL